MGAVRTGGLRLAGAGAAVACLAAAAAIAVAAPAWTPVVAGAVLLAAGFAVMAPCELQMAATLATVLGRRGEASPGAVRRAAVAFTAGYLLVYLPVALALGAVAHVLAGGAWVLTVAGGAGAVVLGLAALGRLGPSWLTACRGPLYLLRSGRASFARPLRAGVAFGQYCATCCGPYVYALVVFAGAARHAWAGAGLVMTYAAAMAIPFLVPVLVAPSRWQALGARLRGIRKDVRLTARHLPTSCVWRFTKIEHGT